MTSRRSLPGTVTSQVKVRSRSLAHRRSGGVKLLSESESMGCLDSEHNLNFCAILITLSSESPPLDGNKGMNGTFPPFITEISGL